MNKRNTFLPLILTLATLLPSCIMRQQLATLRREVPCFGAHIRTPQPQPEDATPWVTVWIHGTRFISKHVLKKIQYCEDGMHHASSLDPYYRLHEITRTLSNCAPYTFPFEHFYLFGWSGALSHQERLHHAKILYAQLNELIAGYRALHGVTPRIRLVTHSHGGNVALNLALVKKPHLALKKIDQLVLLACPVQDRTAHLPYDSLFKKVYNFYSTKDLIQILDPQRVHTNQEKTQTFFSRRRFAKNGYDIAQIQVRINGHGIGHLSFTQDYFLKRLPRLLEEVDAWQPTISQPDNHDKHCVMNLRTRKTRGRRSRKTKHA